MAPTNKVFSVFPINNRFFLFNEASFAFLYYKNERINLLTGEKEVYLIETWFDSLEKINLKNSKIIKGRVIHLFYDLGKLLQEESLDYFNEPLALDINYSKSREIFLDDNKNRDFSFKNIKRPTLNQYKKDFLKGKKELRLGNCYQYNLTYQFINKFLNDSLTPIDFIEKLWGDSAHIGAYAHATYIPFLNKLFLSNSPECLFQIIKNKKSFLLAAMPIKGSLPCQNKSKVSKVYKELKSCSKNKSELNMISDLLRNDLSKIEFPIAKIKSSSIPLYVPGILHQFSKIEINLSSKVNLTQIIKALFPGGSITGAPKKRVMVILEGLEKRSRGFYTGSTILLHKTICAASINIRSAEVDFNSKTISYGAGGGITLKSEYKSEFDEMNLKYQSYFNLFK